MDFLGWLQGLFGGVTSLIALGVIVVVLIIVAIYFRSRYKIAKPNEALVISGGKKELRIIRSGGAFVSPLRESGYFPLGVMTVRSNDQEAQSATLVPVTVMWTAQIRADTKSEGALEKAVTGFFGNSPQDIQNSLQQTLDGEVRAVVATLTPEEVVRDKTKFSQSVTEGVKERMTDLGFELVSLNISEVSDRNNHFANLAAPDRESKRREAETLTAQANREIAVAQAQADQVAESAQLDKQQTVAEKARDVAIKQAGYDRETAEAQGQVTVAKAQQEQAAALAHQEVAITQAETTRKTVEVEAQAEARRREIEAEASVKVAKSEAEGHAEAIRITMQAEADQVRQRGQAEADAARARGEAEAAAILARGQAEAEAEKLMAEALAANEGAQMQIRFAEIERDMRVSIATKTAEVVGNIGEKITIVDMGGSSSNEGGSLVGKVLGDLPKLMHQADMESTLLNGVPLGMLLGNLVRGGGQETPGPLGLRPTAQAAQPSAPAPAAPEAPAAAPVVTSSEVPAEQPAEAPTLDVAPPASEPAGSLPLEEAPEGDLADRVVDGLQAAAEVAPDLLDAGRELRDRISGGKKSSSKKR